MDQFRYKIHHVPGKNFNIADTLSRIPRTSTLHDQDLEELAELLMSAHIDQLPASKDRLRQYSQAQHSDSTRSTLMEYCHGEWPERRKLTLEESWQLVRTLSFFFITIVLLSLHRCKLTKLSKLYQELQGIQLCQLRANMSIWCSGIFHQIYVFASQSFKRCEDALRWCMQKIIHSKWLLCCSSKYLLVWDIVQSYAHGHPLCKTWSFGHFCGFCLHILGMAHVVRPHSNCWTHVMSLLATSCV